MNYQEKVLEHYKIELTEDTWHNGCSLAVYRNLTADGYDIWMINHVGGLDYDHKTDWEHDVFMYTDGIANILFEQMKDRPHETWYIEDLEEIFKNYHWADKWQEIWHDYDNDETLEDNEPDVVEDTSGVDFLLKLADERHQHNK